MDNNILLQKKNSRESTKTFVAILYLHYSAITIDSAKPLAESHNTETHILHS